jgi:hypothetical protein
MSHENWYKTKRLQEGRKPQTRRLYNVEWLVFIIPGAMIGISYMIFYFTPHKFSQETFLFPPYRCGN